MKNKMKKKNEAGKAEWTELPRLGFNLITLNVKSITLL